MLYFLSFLPIFLSQGLNYLNGEQVVKCLNFKILKVLAVCHIEDLTTTGLGFKHSFPFRYWQYREWECPVISCHSLCSLEKSISLELLFFISFHLTSTKVFTGMVTFTILVTMKTELWRCCPYTIFLVAGLPRVNWENRIKTGSRDWERKYKEDSIIFKLANTVSMAGPHSRIKRQPLQNMYVGNWILTQFPTFIISVTLIWRNYKLLLLPFLYFQKKGKMSQCTGCVCSWYPRWHCSKEFACQCRSHRRCSFISLVGKIPWTRKRQYTPFLPGKSHGQRSLVGYIPWGCKELNMTEWLNTHTYMWIASLGDSGDSLVAQG